MEKGKEFHSRNQARSSRFDYIPQADRYLFTEDEPKYKFNIIGSGIIGEEHIKLTHLEGRAVVYGIYDPNPGSIAMGKRAFAELEPDKELVIYESLEEACTDPAADALIICTPNYTHLEVLRVAIRSGKHILLEKTMATTAEDAYEILQLVRDYPAVFQVGLQYRFKSMYQEAIHEALDRQSIGDIKMVNIMEHRIPFLDKVNQWNKFSQYSGGTLVEKCCHYFDLLNLFARSKAVKVYATGSQAVNFSKFEYKGQKSDIIDNALVSIEYANGVRAGFNLCMFAPIFYEEIIVNGDEGRLKAFEHEDQLSLERPRTTLEVMLAESGPSRLGHPAYPAYIEESGHSGATFFEHVYFIDRIEGNATKTASPEEGFWAVVVGAAAQESIKTGQPVFIDEYLKERNIPLEV
jgi:predicted dehydrogenase